MTKEMLICMFSGMFLKFSLLLHPPPFVAVCCGVTQKASQKPIANEMTLINQRVWQAPPESTNSGRGRGGQRQEKLHPGGRTGKGVLNQVVFELISRNG